MNLHKCICLIKEVRKSDKENTIVYRPDVPDRNALIELYDILNQVNMREKRNDLFYTEEQVAELKKDTRNTFL